MKTKRQIFIDPLARQRGPVVDFDLPLVGYVKKYKNASVLFSKRGITESFFTRDSGLYFTPDEYRRQKRGERIARIINRLDSLNSRVFENTRVYAAADRSGFVSVQLRKGYAAFRQTAMDALADSSKKMSMVKVWNLSIVGAVIFGMFLMTMIYRYLGQGVSAAIKETNGAQTQEQDERLATVTEINSSIDVGSITKLLSEQGEKSDLEKDIMDMVKGYPIEKMVPQIAKKDRVVAAFIIGIAKQESDWGKHVPLYRGQDCFNYWGWRGKNAVGTGGHTCFASPEEAVDTVAKRIAFLVSNQKLNTPGKMIVWKCGDCSWDNNRDMNIWINTVGTYFKKLNASD